MIEHGLYEEATEETSPSEGEQEGEPGLLRVIDFAGGSISLGGTVFTAREVKEYETHTVLFLEMWEEEGGGNRTRQVTVPHGPGERYDLMTVEGEDFRWDREDCCLRAIPKVQEEDAAVSGKDPVRMIEQLVLRVDRAMAEERLSPECLEYACRKGEAWYDWSVPDGAHYTVLAELDLVDTEVERGRLKIMLNSFCGYYWNKTERL